LGECFLWTVFLKMTKVAKTSGLLFSMVKFLYLFCKICVGLHVGRFLLKLIWPPWLQSSISYPIHSDADFVPKSEPSDRANRRMWKQCICSNLWGKTNIFNICATLYLGWIWFCFPKLWMQRQ
jgi:hypothetical protein